MSEIVAHGSELGAAVARTWLALVWRIQCGVARCSFSEVAGPSCSITWAVVSKKRRSTARKRPAVIIEPSSSMFASSGVAGSHRDGVVGSPRWAGYLPVTADEIALAAIAAAMHMRRTAGRLFGDQWSILGAGRGQIALASIGAAMGSHVRVGLEDSLWIGPGQRAKSSAEQVTRIRTVLEALNLEIATPAEARALLALKGGNNVAF